MERPMFAPRTVRLLDPVPAKFARRTTLTIETENDNPAVALPVR
jgi:hypothetical protein